MNLLVCCEQVGIWQISMSKYCTVMPKIHQQGKPQVSRNPYTSFPLFCSSFPNHNGPTNIILSSLPRHTDLSASIEVKTICNITTDFRAEMFPDLEIRYNAAGSAYRALPYSLLMNITAEDAEWIVSANDQRRGSGITTINYESQWSFDHSLFVSHWTCTYVCKVVDQHQKLHKGGNCAWKVYYCY